MLRTVDLNRMNTRSRCVCLTFSSVCGAATMRQRVVRRGLLSFRAASQACHRLPPCIPLPQSAHAPHPCAVLLARCCLPHRRRRSRKKREAESRGVESIAPHASALLRCMLMPRCCIIYLFVAALRFQIQHAIVRPPARSPRSPFLSSPLSALPSSWTSPLRSYRRCPHSPHTRCNHT